MDKEKGQINELAIKHNTLNAQLKKDPLNEPLSQQVSALKRDLARRYDHWNGRDGSGFTVSGELRTRLYQQGYGNLTDKKEPFKALTQQWNRMLDDTSVR